MKKYISILAVLLMLSLTACSNQGTTPTGTGNTSNTTYYVADITLSSTDYLKTALAQDTLGTNITETTSSIASSKNAFLPLTVTITALIRQVM